MKTNWSSVVVAVVMLLIVSGNAHSQVVEHSSSPIKGYAMEFLGAEIGYIGGVAVTGALFVTGFLSLWAGNKVGLPLMLGSFATGLATPLFTGYMIHKFGRKYNPDGKARYAILGSYAGLVAAGGIGYLASFSNSSDRAWSGSQLINVATSITGAVLPAVVGIFFYNYFPRAKETGIGQSLVSKNSYGFSAGIPSLSYGSYPGMPGKFYTQISLFSATF